MKKKEVAPILPPLAPKFVPHTWLMGFPIEVIPQKEGQGGKFEFPDDDCHHARVYIGLNYSRWCGVLDVIIHECLEFTLLAADFRYHTDLMSNSSSSGSLFIMSHDQFQTAVTRATSAADDIIDLVRPQWKKLQREKSQRKK